VRTARPWILPAQPAPRAILLGGGVSAAMVRTQLAAGRLIRIRSGVYVAAEAWPEDPAGQHLVRAHAEQAVNPAAVLSHGTAALSWRLPHPGFVPWSDGPVTVTVPAGATHKSRNRGVVQHLLPLPAAQVTRDPHGYLITTLQRTAVDLAGGLPLPEALVILDATSRLLCQSLVVGARRRDFGNPRLVRASRGMLLEAAGVRRLPGLAAAIDRCDPGRESPAESLSAGWFALEGLPTPLFQPPVDTPFGTLYPDCLWPEARLIGECDGAMKYADAHGYVNEKEREQVLRDLDFRIVRWLAKEIMLDPQRVVERVARKLQAS